MDVATTPDERGFTLIELVIVIILIGILAATALPKFANLTTQARDASNQGVEGGLSAAVSIAHAAWIAAGAPSSSSTVTLDTTTVNINANGWPDGGAGSITTITAAQCVAMWSQILNNPPLAQAGGTCPSGNTNCYIVTAATSICTFTLGTDALITTTYNIANGAVGFTSH